MRLSNKGNTDVSCPIFSAIDEREARFSRTPLKGQVLARSSDQREHTQSMIDTVSVRIVLFVET